MVSHPWLLYIPFRSRPFQSIPRLLIQLFHSVLRLCTIFFVASFDPSVHLRSLHAPSTCVVSCSVLCLSGIRSSSLLQSSLQSFPQLLPIALPWLVFSPASASDISLAVAQQHSPAFQSRSLCLSPQLPWHASLHACQSIAPPGSPSAQLSVIPTVSLA
jgi:hypothetical protein